MHIAFKNFARNMQRMLFEHRSGSSKTSLGEGVTDRWFATWGESVN